VAVFKITAPTAAPAIAAPPKIALPINEPSFLNLLPSLPIRRFERRVNLAILFPILETGRLILSMPLKTAEIENLEAILWDYLLFAGFVASFKPGMSGL